MCVALQALAGELGWVWASLGAGLVLLNAGASLYIGGKADTMADGIQLAARLIDSGKAAAVLEKFIEVSNRPEENA